MPISSIAIGTPAEASSPDALKAALAEFISMLIFVFAGEGAGMAFGKLTDGGAATPAGLISASIAHAFALFVAVSCLGSVVACLLLKFATGGLETSGFCTFIGCGRVECSCV
ncbi:unnamed protein product [Lactuca saligna]|uniref:Uncharacterized protein n=1 Tax=Lactuca saligna TaxID=75948 RepID=A0AA35ZU45_LACSI|nr:unnamed protein product [Lactuca saligna]